MSEFPLFLVALFRIDECIYCDKSYYHSINVKAYITVATGGSKRGLNG